MAKVAGRMVVVAVFDRVAELFGSPQTMQSDGAAIRMFSDGINNPSEDNLLYKHPDDFDLYAICGYDPSTGLFVDTDTGPRRLVMGRDVVVDKSRVITEDRGLKAVN